MGLTADVEEGVGPVGSPDVRDPVGGNVELGGTNGAVQPSEAQVQRGGLGRPS